MLDFKLESDLRSTLSGMSVPGLDLDTLCPFTVGPAAALSEFFTCRAGDRELFVKLAMDDGRDRVLAREVALHQRLAEVGFTELVPCLRSGPLVSRHRSGCVNLYPLVEHDARYVDPECAGRLIARFHEAGARLVGAAPEFDQVLLHGDLRDANVLVSGDGCRLIDFEFCSVGNRIWDLGCLPLFLRRPDTLVGPLPAPDLLEMIGSYEDERIRLPRLSRHPLLPLSRILEVAAVLHRGIARQVAPMAPAAAEALALNSDAWIERLQKLTSRRACTHG